MKLRSLLYVPAHEERFIAKAHERGADAIILDLEDAVPLDQKDAARDELYESVKRVGRNGATVFVRINSDPELQRADVEAACFANADGIYVPKVEDPRSLQSLANLSAKLETEVGRDQLLFVAMVESPGAVLEARQLARHTRVIGLCVGSEDLALRMGAEPSPEVLFMPKLMVHLAAKAEGKLSFGTLATIADYSDLEAMRKSAEQAQRFGFDGASCVHPSAVPVLNTAFLPSTDQVAWAQRVCDAQTASKGKAVFSVDGKMVDAPVLARANAILEKSAS